MAELNTAPTAQAVTAAESALLDVNAVAALCACSTRHIRRLADAGMMPRPVKLGALVRWSRAEVQRWLDDGCPNMRSRAAR